VLSTLLIASAGPAQQLGSSVQAESQLPAAAEQQPAMIVLNANSAEKNQMTA
jgi:hypothetical protein